MLVGLFALVSSSLTACSVEVGPAGSEQGDNVGPAAEGAGTVASELTSTGDLPILVCPSPAVDVTSPLHPGWKQEATGAVDASQACDWFVFELTGTLGGDIVLTAKSGAVNALGIPNEAKCNASMMSARVTGQLPGYYTFENGTLVYHPGAWETISTFSERGVWLGGTVCAFPAFQQIKNLSSGMIMDSPHTRIRVATRAILQTANGSVATPLTSIADRKDY